MHSFFFREIQLLTILFVISDSYMSWTIRSKHNNEAVTGDVLEEKVFLEISQNSWENTCASLFFDKVADLRPATLFKK